MLKLFTAHNSICTQKVFLTRIQKDLPWTSEGQVRFAAFAGGKHAPRALAQSMARELGPEGIHVAHVIN